MSNWRPIETAPKDGTWVLLRGGETTEYDAPDAISEKMVARPVTAFYLREKGWHAWEGWAVSFWDSAWRTAYNNPTHWMPIPELDA